MEPQVFGSFVGGGNVGLVGVRRHAASAAVRVRFSRVGFWKSEA
jgi:hypothetical protein